MGKDGPTLEYTCKEGEGIVNTEEFIRIKNLLDEWASSEACKEISFVEWLSKEENVISLGHKSTSLFQRKGL